MQHTPFTEPITLEGYGVKLMPLKAQHQQALAAAAADGELWNLRYTSVPEPENTASYIQQAHEMLALGTRLPFTVFDTQNNTVLGSTSYHDIVPNIRRVEIGYTWYAQSAQRTGVNTACKLLLLTHAFETLHCNVVGFRTDIFNRKSRNAIERLGAKLDGILRGHALRRDQTIRDTVMYSITSGEWPEIKAHLLALIKKNHKNP